MSVGMSFRAVQIEAQHGRMDMRPTMQATFTHVLRERGRDKLTVISNITSAGPGSTLHEQYYELLHRYAFKEISPEQLKAGLERLMALYQVMEERGDFEFEPPPRIEDYDDPPEPDVI